MIIVRMKVNMTQTKTNIVIVGGGFGGVKAAEELSRNSLFHVTLISDRPDFWYYPSLYRTATGAPEQLSSIPLNDLFGHTNVQIVIGKASHLDQQKKTLQLENDMIIAYDELILSLGVVTNYFGIKGLAEFSYGIKSIGEAKELKTHLHRQLLDEKKPDLHYIVVGGGPTGIELAAQLPEYLRYIMKEHGLPRRPIHVSLVEAAPHLLPRMKASVGKAIEKRLRHLGVKLYLKTAVKGETIDSLQINDRSLKSHTVIWTAGQANNPFFETNNFTITKRHKVLVDEFLQAMPHVYVIGDNADTEYSGMAQTALIDAVFVAQNILRQYRGTPQQSYVPVKPVYVFPAGKGWAYVEWGRYRFHGWIGWLLREAGDIKGLLDIENPIKASGQWLKEFQIDDDCETCNPAKK
jgi:NADH dehydrogenase